MSQRAIENKLADTVPSNQLKENVLNNFDLSAVDLTPG